jgi:hypothetical protein
LSARESERPAAYLADTSTFEKPDFLFPTIEFVLASDEADVLLLGDLKGFTQPADGPRWARIASRDALHVPGTAKHAFRNPSIAPAVMVAVTTARMGRFIQEIGRPVRRVGKPLAPSSAELMRHTFWRPPIDMAIWIETPEENAEIGLTMLPLHETRRARQ